LNSLGRVALVTGAATGIGRAVAVRFAQQGMAVAVNYSRSEADAKETVAMVERAGVRALLCKANVADDRAVRAMVQRCHADLEALTDEVWQEIFDVNLKGTFYGCRAAFPLLKERGGSIVNVTSVAGLKGDGSSIPYAASKAALNCLTKSLAKSLAPHVRVNAVAPGPVLTRWLADYADRVEQFVKQTPLGRAAEPDDIADTVVFLATGTTLMTGQVVVVDGGRTM
jgi:3-oxoacyl-[acyl-carrier protein] reductase